MSLACDRCWKLEGVTATLSLPSPHCIAAANYCTPRSSAKKKSRVCPKEIEVSIKRSRRGAMGVSVPASLRKVKVFLTRADELDRDKGNPESRVVAFNCRQYAVLSGIPLAQDAEAKACLGDLLNLLEKEKVREPQQPEILRCSLTIHSSKGSQ